MEVIKIKTCTNCKKKKPLTQFNKDRQYFDGYNPKCRKCSNEYRNYRNFITGKTKKSLYDTYIKPDNLISVVSLLNDIINQTDEEHLNKYVKGEIKPIILWE